MFKRPERVIQSLLDLDQYKLSMCQAALHQFPSTEVELEFKCRDEQMALPLYHIKDSVEREFREISGMRFTDEELKYLGTFPFFKRDFIEFLRIYTPNVDLVEFTGNYGEPLGITIKGPWIHVILFETYLLSIVNQLYYEHWERTSEPSFSWEYVGEKNLQQKIKILKTAPDGFSFSDFGTRRRFNFTWQEHVVTEFAKTGRLVGTSNVLLAMKHGLKAIGTQAHEWYQAGQALTRLEDSLTFMLDAWVREYRGQLGTALSDIVGVDAFLRNFDLFFCKVYDGVRHDSGDPFEFGEKIIAHYKKMGIDPKTKLIVFSDGLDIEKSIKLYNYFVDRIKVAFGIGTNLTNDVGFKALQIVIKMVRCNGQPVAKLSDSPGKCMCKEEWFLEDLKRAFKIKS